MGYVLRPGVHLCEDGQHYSIVDEIRQVEVPINRSGYELLCGATECRDFSEEETQFLQELASLFLIVPSEVHALALGWSRSFKESPPVYTRMAPI